MCFCLLLCVNKMFQLVYICARLCHAAPQSSITTSDVTICMPYKLFCAFNKFSSPHIIASGFLKNPV
jgi:hypothetical protein